MIREAIVTDAPPQDVRLSGPANWTAVIFFAVLSSLHLSICLPAFYYGRIEGYLSLIMAAVFMSASIIAFFCRYSLTVSTANRRIRLSTGWGALRYIRHIPFADVHAVRLTLGHGGRSSEAGIRILCDNEDIECPPTSIPRQQALYLAMTMNVQLIKVSDDDETDPVSDRAI